MTTVPRKNVLLVEDSESDALLVRRYMANDDRFELWHAPTLQESTCALTNGRDFSAVLLDLNLPDSRGLNTFSALNRLRPDIPVVILGGIDDVRVGTQALSMGAQDYVPKIELTEPLLIRSLLYAIERQQRQHIEDHYQFVEHELHTAHCIQAHLLPGAAPKIAGYDIAGCCCPAHSCAGDFFDYIPVTDGKWDILIADVSGHGFAPALIMAGTRRVLRSCAEMHNNVGDILTIANRAVAEDTLVQQFVTMFYMRLDTTDGTVSHATAGHPAWIIRANGSVETLSSENIPLGVIKSRQYESEDSATLCEDDILLLMTDGVWEATNPSDEFFGRERVFDLVRNHRQKRSADILKVILDDITAFSSQASSIDDITMVLVKVAA